MVNQMKWIEAKVIFEHPDKDLAADLISDIFFGFGIQGVSLEDPELESGQDWAEGAVWRPGHHAVIGYFRKDNRSETKCKILAQKLADLNIEPGLHHRISYKEIDEENWAEAWKAFFWPKRISQKIVVKPTWRDYAARPGDIVLELDPGMAFGTGTHPTTVLSMGLIESHLKKGDSFLDVGTGSGILMIAAAKLGAAEVCGVDKDEAAVAIASQNLDLNRIGLCPYSLCCGHLVEPVKKRYDFVAANILTPVILELLNVIQTVLNSRGVFVCSGIIEKSKAPVIARLKKVGFEVLETQQQDEWVAIAARLRT